jgi:hypothetical protein
MSEKLELAIDNPARSLYLNLHVKNWPLKAYSEFWSGQLSNDAKMKTRFNKNISIVASIVYGPNSLIQTIR